MTGERVSKRPGEPGRLGGRFRSLTGRISVSRHTVRRDLGMCLPDSCRARGLRHGARTAAKATRAGADCTAKVRMCPHTAVLQRPVETHLAVSQCRIPGEGNYPLGPTLRRKVAIASARVLSRRMEAYLYFDMEETTRILHFMREPHGPGIMQSVRPMAGETT